MRTQVPELDDCAGIRLVVGPCNDLRRGIRVVVPDLDWPPECPVPHWPKIPVVGQDIRVESGVDDSLGESRLVVERHADYVRALIKQD